ncbi:hypothetical protein PG997_008859 [Apiospora hydei]|uniref:Rhodopsin domain-containing protein n=1 Tax=Apiospora hydei TaxID=1337664 RepID=A0ABR1WC10_9PEZI
MASQAVTPLTMAPQVKAPLAINCTILFLVLIVVGMRIWTRVRGVGLGLDDGLAVVATILGILCLGLQGFFSTIGMGYDAIPFSPDYEQHPLRLRHALRPRPGPHPNQRPLLLPARLRQGPGGLRRTIQGLLGVVGAWAIAFSLALAFICHPMPFRWDPTIPGGACGSQTAMYATLIITNVLLDLVIMLLPMYIVWSLKMRGPEKIGLMACFALGLAVVIASCVRLTTIFDNNSDTNPSGNSTGGALSTNVFLCVFEVLLGLLCISLPTLGPLYIRLTSRFLRTSSRLRGGNSRGARRLYGYGHSSSASGSSSTVPPSPPSGLNQHPPSTRSAMSMRDEGGSSSSRNHHRRTFGTAGRSSQQHYSPAAAAATTRMGYNQNTVSSYATTAVNSSVPAAWQLNDPLTFPPLTLQTPPLTQPPSSSYASAQGRDRYNRHSRTDPNAALTNDINATSQLFRSRRLYPDSDISSLSSTEHDDRRSDEPFSDNYYAARERARLLQQGTDVENMAHLFPLPPSRKGPLASLTPPSTSHGRSDSKSTTTMTTMTNMFKGGPFETSWLSMHD